MTDYPLPARPSLVGIDRLIDRQAARDDARAAGPCPSCHAETGHQCRDRYGQVTSLVHASRYHAAAIDVAVDIYALEDDGRIDPSRFEGGIGDYQADRPLARHSRPHSRSHAGLVRTSGWVPPRVVRYEVHAGTLPAGLTLSVATADWHDVEAGNDSTDPVVIARTDSGPGGSDA